MLLAFITLKAPYLAGIFAAGFVLGYGIQIKRVRHFRNKQIAAEQEKLKMQAQMLGMGDYYEPNK
jgi:hypothetical protein